MMQLLQSMGTPLLLKVLKGTYFNHKLLNHMQYSYLLFHDYITCPFVVFLYWNCILIYRNIAIHSYASALYKTWSNAFGPDHVVGIKYIKKHLNQIMKDYNSKVYIPGIILKLLDFYSYK